jgi:succinyl-CoA synthetase beta subunit
MNIHEYQGKALFRKYGIKVPFGIPLFAASEAEAAAQKVIDETKIPVVVVKAQIHAGGRGKAGGVKVVKDGPAGAAKVANALFGVNLVTHQTGPAGQQIKRMYVEQGLDIARELYLGLVVDRAARRIAVMASTEGGVEIETVAEHTPEKILTEHIDPVTGLGGFQIRKLAFGLRVTEGSPDPKKTMKQFGDLLSKLAILFEKEDCSLCEVNPLVITKSGDVVALDAKITFDDNAHARHPEWDELLDKGEEDPVELEAQEAGLSYVSLEGNIGCLVNGAGLAMATMDIIKHHGGQPANFLDVGGSATKEQVTKAFSMILSSPHVRGIFVNIFGGIAKCDLIAEGIVAATKELGLKVPLVVRLEGTNVDLGKKILKESGLAIQAADSMADGAKKIVSAVAS